MEARHRVTNALLILFLTLRFSLSSLPAFLTRTSSFDTSSQPHHQSPNFFLGGAFLAAAAFCLDAGD